MKMSRRAVRMEKHHKRKRSALGINLVSLMDIFTILVFFLLVNSSDGEVLPTHKSVALPESVSEEQPRQTVVVRTMLCDTVDQMNVGDEVEVEYRLSGRKWQRDQNSEVKYFLSAEALGFTTVEFARVFHQGVLQTLALLVLVHLTFRRLPQVHDCLALKMRRVDLLLLVRIRHRFPPLSGCELPRSPWPW